MRGTVIIMMALQTERKVIENTNQKIEDALNHLMIQFRQIEEKYGLMVSKEIDEKYHRRVGLIMYSYDCLDQSIRDLDTK